MTKNNTKMSEIEESVPEEPKLYTKDGVSESISQAKLDVLEDVERELIIDSITQLDPLDGKVPTKHPWTDQAVFGMIDVFNLRLGKIISTLKQKYTKERKI